MKTDIKLNNFYPDLYPVYKNGMYFGEISNEYELNDLRIQIAKTRTDGFSVIFEDKIITIDNKGQLSEWPYGFYDTTMQQLAELFKVQRQIRKDDNWYNTVSINAPKLELIGNIVTGGGGYSYEDRDKFGTESFHKSYKLYSEKEVESSPEFFAPLMFVSDDGVDIYKGDTYWLKTTDNRIVEMTYKTCQYTYEDGAILDGQKTFSSKESAQRWIDEQNKPKYVEGEWLHCKGDSEEWLFRFASYRTDGHLNHKENYYIDSKTNKLYESTNGWFLNNSCVSKPDVDTIQRILTKVAIHKGFKEGVKYKNACGKGITAYITNCELEYRNCDDVLFNGYGNGYIYCHGKWAEIIPNEVPVVLPQDYPCVYTKIIAPNTLSVNLLGSQGYEVTSIGFDKNEVKINYKVK